MQKQNHGEYECGFNVRKGAEVSKTQGISRHTTIHIISRGISKRPLIHSFSNMFLDECLQTNKLDLILL